MGFSAGGHLAASMSCYFTEDKYSKYLNVPKEHIVINGCVLGYPVITMGDYTHQITMENVTKKKKAERLIQYLSSILCGQKFETAKTSLSFRKSSVVQINDELLVPEEFMKVKTEKKPDKNAIANRIKGGEYVPGCELAVKNNLQIK